MTESVHVGITFYGGVSLAVFEAGVAYELVRAMQYSREPSRPGGQPEIHVDVVSGTSAGGLAAAQLAAAIAGRDVEGVLTQMVSMWANEADILRLLPARDYPGQGLLDNTALGENVARLLKVAASGRSEPSLLSKASDISVFLTLTNLSGLREPVSVRQDDSAEVATFPTTRHCEYETFTSRDVLEDARHARFVEACKITAGFPVAFPPTSKPSRSIEDDRTRFVYIDGGIVDNRPLGIALDAIGERPARRRRFIFIDPSETYVAPDYGRADERPNPDRRLDPYYIYSRLLDVARSDSIYRDLRRIQEIKETLDLFEPLSRKVYEDTAFREDLLEIYPRVVGRELNPAAWSLCTLIRDDVSEALRASMAKMERQERFFARARIKEFLGHMGRGGPGEGTAATVQSGGFGRALEEIQAILDEPERWQDYYGALTRVRALDRRFRQLSYLAWEAHYKHRVPGPLDEALQARIEAAFDELADRAEALKSAREALQREVAQRIGASAEIQQHFFAYARAMQVLESLAGLRNTQDFSVDRLTPFDIYDEGVDKGAMQPLAGGYLGAFGGFLSKAWRLNDFLVGRLAMRRNLLRSGLIVEAAYGDYLAFCADRDTSRVAPQLSAGSAERARLEVFAGLGRQDMPPYRETNVPGLLLRPTDMDPDTLPAGMVARVIRRMTASLRRLVGLNERRAPYRYMRVLTPLFYVASGLIWFTENTLRCTSGPEPTAPSLLVTLRWGLIIFALGVGAGIVLRSLV